MTILCAHHAAVVAATIRAVPHLDPDERDRPLTTSLDSASNAPTTRRTTSELHQAPLPRPRLSGPRISSPAPQDSTRRGKQERRAYHCHACNGWHLTSMERR